MKKVEVRIIRDDKKEFTLDNVVWGIASDGLIGFDTVDVESFNESTQVGSRHTGIKVKDKDRTIKGRLMNPALNEIQRAVAISFFNPLHTFKVYVTYQGRTRWCEGRQIAFECPSKNIYEPIEVTWTILSNMPYMLSTENFGENIGELVPLFSFPYGSPIGAGFGVGAYKFAKEVFVENKGDVDTLFQVSITATGDVTNPKLIKDNKYVRMIDTMKNGDVYLIDFVANPPTIKKNGENYMRKIDKTSALLDMALEVGGSTFGFDADSGSKNMKVEIYRHERYLGL